MEALPGHRRPCCAARLRTPCGLFVRAAAGLGRVSAQPRRRAAEVRGAAQPVDPRRGRQGTSTSFVKLSPSARRSRLHRWSKKSRRGPAEARPAQDSAPSWAGIQLKPVPKRPMPPPPPPPPPPKLHVKKPAPLPPPKAKPAAPPVARQEGCCAREKGGTREECRPQARPGQEGCCEEALDAEALDQSGQIRRSAVPTTVVAAVAISWVAVDCSSAESFTACAAYALPCAARAPRRPRSPPACPPAHGAPPLRAPPCPPPDSPLPLP